MTGLAIAIFGAALCAALAGCGSAIGVMAAAKRRRESPPRSRSCSANLLVLQALPGTQGIYGFLTAILIMVRLGLLGGSPLDISDTVGWQFFLCRPCLWGCAG